MALIVKIKFLAGYLEGLEYQYVKKNKLSCMNKMFGAPALYLTDIVSMEVASEENVKKLGGTLGGALVGGILLGDVGALVGGLSSGKTTESTIICTFKDGQKSLAKVNSPMMEVLQTHLFNLENKAGYAAGKPEKMALWKKIAIGCVVLSALAAFSKNDEKSTDMKQAATTEASERQETKKEEEWKKAFENAIRGAMPKSDKFGSYEISFHVLQENNCVAVLTYNNTKINNSDASRISKNVVTAIVNDFIRQGKDTVKDEIHAGALIENKINGNNIQIIGYSQYNFTNKKIEWVPNE